jgi:O-antigen/teichoic acid export membrane protein
VVTSQAGWIEGGSVSAARAGFGCGKNPEASTEIPEPLLFVRLTQIVERSKGVLALCDQGAVSITNFLTGMAIGRWAGKSELGLYAVCWTLTLVAAEVSAALITTPYTVFGPQMGKTDRGRYLGSMFMQQLALSALMASAILLGAVVASARGVPNALAHASIATAAAVAFMCLREFGRRICFADLNVLSALVLDAAACGFQIAGMVLLWKRGSLTAFNVFILIGGLSIGVTLAWLLLYRTRLCIQRRYWMSGLKHNWDFAKWVLAGGFIMAMAMQLYPWLLTLLHGSEVTGIWAACYATGALGNPVLVGLGNYLGPKISNVYASDGARPMQRYVYRSSMLLASLLLPFVAVLVVCGGRIMSTMYGAAYAGNGLVVALLGINVLIVAFNFPYSRGLLVLLAARADMLVSLAAIVILFTVGIAAIRTHSVVGAATALLLSTTVTTGIRVGVFTRAARGKYTSPGRTTEVWPLGRHPGPVGGGHSAVTAATSFEALGGLPGGSMGGV